jgi:hypothetical protein
MVTAVAEELMRVAAVYCCNARAADLTGDLRPEIRPDGPRPVRWGPLHEMHYIALASIAMALRDV